MEAKSESEEGTEIPLLRALRPGLADGRVKAAWKHVGKKGKAPGMDGVKAEDILAEENGVKKFLAVLHEELKSKSYRPSPVKRVDIPKADGSERPLGIPIYDADLKSHYQYLQDIGLIRL